MAKIMHGIRILEVAQHTFMPVAGAILADWGADVIIEVEAADGGPLKLVRPPSIRKPS
jgi:crotonobetainyl-CoA:carnitine CoA-transferase CaiB-like acyl-CoA transferase